MPALNRLNLARYGLSLGHAESERTGKRMPAVFQMVDGKTVKHLHDTIAGRDSFARNLLARLATGRPQAKEG